MEIYGVFNGNIWRDEMNGKSFFRLITKHEFILPEMYQREFMMHNTLTDLDEKWYEIKCAATDVSVPSLDKNTPVKITGFFLEGQESEVMDFMIESFRIGSNDDMTAYRYMTSFTGINDEIARYLLLSYGNDILSITKPEVVTILEERGVKEEHIKAFVSTITKKHAECIVFEEWGHVKIPYPYVIKAVKHYGINAIKVFRLDPYEGLKIGLTFKQCDRLAKRYNFTHLSPNRIRAVTDVVMTRLSNEGHTYTDLKEYQRQAAYMVEHYGDYGDIIPSASIEFVKSDRYDIVRSPSSAVISKKIYYAERSVAENVKRLCSKKEEPYREDMLPIIEHKCNMTFGKQQRSAFEMMRYRGIKILTGGPGTGKTTTVKGLIYCYEMMHPDHKIRLAAPTGKAAQRLAESTEMPATTIHKLLEYIPYGESPTVRDEKNPIDADFIVIDEVSMVDIELFDLLLKAVKTGTSILLVGDIHQLESVGPGAVLRDLLGVSRNVIPSTFLTEVFRQKGDSVIIDNSIKVNEGKTDLRTIKGSCLTSKFSAHPIKEMRESTL